MWQAWERHGILPCLGGWRNQPLHLLSVIDAIDLTYNTWRYIRAQGSDWTKLTPTQRALVAWLEGDND